MKIIKTSALLLVGFLSLSGIFCESINPDRLRAIALESDLPTSIAQDPLPINNTLENTTWTLLSWTEQSGSKTPLADSKITLNFTQDRLSGSSGCNQYIGGYRLDQQLLKVGTLGSTLRACPDEIMAQEFQYLTALQAATRYEIDAQGQLRISYSQGTEEGVLIFGTQPTIRLEGSSWRLTRWEDAESTGVPLAETIIDATFVDGKVAGSSGCNRYIGSYQTEENTLKVSEIATTKKACPEPILKQESRFVMALQGAQNYEISPQQQLTIFYNSQESSGSMTFVLEETSANPL
ncbi:MAG: META domain-containing protein [Microcoleaceae cyanobacterium]